MITSITIVSTRDREREVEEFFYKLFKEIDKDNKQFTYTKSIGRRGDTSNIYYVANEDLKISEEEMEKKSFIDLIRIEKEDKAFPQLLLECLYR